MKYISVFAISILDVALLLSDVLTSTAKRIKGVKFILLLSASLLINGAEGSVTYYSYNKINVSGSSLPFTHPDQSSKWAPYWWTMPVSGAKVERVKCLATVVKIDVPSDTAVICEMRNVSAPRAGRFYADIFTSDPSASSAPSTLYSQTMGTVASPGTLTIPFQSGYGYGKSYWVRIHYEPSSYVVEKSYTATFDLAFSRADGVTPGEQPSTTLSFISIIGSSELFPGSSTNYTCVATMSDGSTKQVKATWSIKSAPANRAIINSSTGKLESNKWSDLTSTVDVVIQASYTLGETKTATKTVTILVPIDYITISGDSSIKAGSQKSYLCVATMADGSTKNVEAIWSIDSGGSYGSISSSGILTAGSSAASKEIVIKATHTEGIITCSSKKTISITAGAVVVTFNKQSGSGGTTSTTATYGSAMPSITIPTRTGYTFDGYYIAKNGVGAQYYTSTGASARNWDRTSETTLYANWTANTYSVTFNKQSGSSGTSSVTATYGSAMPSITIPTRAGYTFDGYYTATNGGGTQYYTSTGASARNWDRTSATTLYAKWAEPDVEYTIENGILTNVEMNGRDVAEIPSGVTRIGSGAFNCTRDLKTVIIPSSVAEIGYQAFYGCSKLEEVRFPPQLDSIGMSAFAGCASLTQIVIPNGVKFIAQTAFASCTSLESVIMPESTVEICGWAFEHCTSLTNIVFSSQLREIGCYAFLMCNDKLFDQDWLANGVNVVNGWIVGFSDASPKDINATGIVGMAESAFCECDGLGSIVFGDSLTTIPEGAFSWCINLTNVCLGTSVVNINNAAFYKCFRLREMTIPSSIEKMGRDIFYGCTNLVSIIFEGDAPKSVNGEAFSGVDDDCTVYVSKDSAGWNVGIPGNWKGINIDYLPCPHNAGVSLVNEVSPTCSSEGYTGDYVCNLCNAVLTQGTPIESLAHEEGEADVTREPTEDVDGEISYRCIHCGTVLRTETIPHLEPIWEISQSGTLLSVDLNKCRNIVIPSSVRYINHYAMTNSPIRSVVIPSSVKYLGYYAFKDCHELENVVIGDGILQINYAAFNGCKNLRDVKIGRHVTDLGYASFYGCERLESIIIPNTVTNIGDHAFEGCSNLKAIKGGAGVEKIGYAGFAYCAKLPTVPSFEKLETISNFSFYNCVSLDKVTLSVYLTEIGYAAFYNCNSLTSLVFKSAAPTVGDLAFHYVHQGCTAHLPRGAAGYDLVDSKWRGLSVEWYDYVAKQEPYMLGDDDAIITQNANGDYIIKPGDWNKNVVVSMSNNLADKSVVVEVPSDIETISPNGAKIRVLANGSDITNYLNIPESVGGVIDMTKAVVKEEVAKETLDSEKGAIINIDPESPSLTTSETKAGLTYTLLEGTSLPLSDKNRGDFKVGDGSKWTPAITVKGGNAGFYTIDVSK